MEHARSFKTALFGTLCAAAFAAPAHAALEANDVLNLSLEQLTNMEVTSVSKKSEKASEAPAAIFVITSDDIRRLGATSIPEALRVVPGMSVAQSGTHQWAVSSRGFNDQFANKLLVLIDGRTVYTPLFNGVWWSEQDVVLEDIERIEVIRGPGATLWGANAVNGVINIITKNAKDTQGTFISQTNGTHDRDITTVRHGMNVGENANVRVYGKYLNRDEFRNLADNNDSNDRLTQGRSGFRADWKSGSSTWTTQGDVYVGSEHQEVNLPSLVTPPTITAMTDMQTKGGNVLGRWNYAVSPQSDITLQAYVDNVQRDTIAFQDTTTTFDLDLQHSWSAWERNEIVWGMGYRRIHDTIDSTQYYLVTPRTRDDDLFSAFVQDKFTIMPEKLFLTLGSKFEHNDYSGSEYQPSARLSWLIDTNQTFWTSVSRAVKTPYRGTEDAGLVLSVFPTVGPVGFAGAVPNPELSSERLIAYEAGYRIQPLPNVSFDTAVFYNDYSNLFSGMFGAPTVLTLPVIGPQLYLPVIPVNGGGARSYGAEVAANWEVTQTWQLAASYSFIDLKFDDTSSVGFSFVGKEPEQQFSVRSTWLLPHNVEINNAMYYVDSLPGASISDYVRFDARIAWKPTEGVELSLIGQNLLDPVHPEFSAFVFQNAAQVPRAVYGNVTLRF